MLRKWVAICAFARLPISSSDEAELSLMLPEHANMPLGKAIVISREIAAEAACGKSRGRPRAVVAVQDAFDAVQHRRA